MVKNSKLLVSTALLSSFLIGNIANAHNRSEIDELSSRGIVKQMRAQKEADEMIGNIDNPSGWHIYQAPRLTSDEQIDVYMNTMALQKKAFEKVGEGTLYPEAPGANIQKATRFATKVASTALEIAKPFVVATGVRVVGDIILSQVGPWLAEEAGKVAATAASKANSWWTQYDPTGWADQGIRATAKATAKGEALRDLGTLTYYVETYGAPAVKTAYKATCTAANVAKSAAHKAYGWCSSWFGAKESTKPVSA